MVADALQELVLRGTLAREGRRYVVSSGPPPAAVAIGVGGVLGAGAVSAAALAPSSSANPQTYPAPTPGDAPTPSSSLPPLRAPDRNRVALVLAEMRDDAREGRPLPNRRAVMNHYGIGAATTHQVFERLESGTEFDVADDGKITYRGEKPPPAAFARSGGDQLSSRSQSGDREVCSAPASEVRGPA
jgi:hypothetical protein